MENYDENLTYIMKYSENVVSIGTVYAFLISLSVEKSKTYFFAEK